MRHLPDCDDFSTEISLENHSLSLPAWPSLDGSSPCFYNPNLVASTGAKTGWLMGTSPYFSLQNL